MSDPIDVTTLTDDDLRLVVAEVGSACRASKCASIALKSGPEQQQSADGYLRHAQDYNVRAAAAGYVVGGKRGTIHRWDCSSIQSYVRTVVETAGDVATTNDAGVQRNGNYLRCLPW